MSGAFAKLVTEDRLAEMVNGIQDALEISFITCPMRVKTRSEEKRRIDICHRIFEVCRGDLGWTLEKTLDFLPTYLQCELEGVPYNPQDVGENWSPEVIPTVHGLDE